MTENDWLTCRRVDRMLDWLLASGEPIRTRWQGPMLTHVRRTSDRKLRLFACACRRRRENGAAVAEAIEDWLDGRISADACDARLRLLGYINRSAPLEQASFDLPTGTVVESLRTGFGILHGYEADLLREVVGNPFRPAALTPALLAWNDGTIPRLAETIAANRTYGDLPILGDALEEAGCADERLVAHCRGGVHAAGCWVLDAACGRA
jgi:hypothetical protein